MEKGQKPQIATQPDLSAELKDQKSRLYAESFVVEGLKKSEDPFFEPQLEHFHQQVRQHCPHYRPDVLDENQILCDSGSMGRIPYRGRTCAAGCLFSQIILKDDVFRYEGPYPSVEDQLVHEVIFPPVKLRPVE
jgi:hypothetical protein